MAFKQAESQKYLDIVSGFVEISNPGAGVGKLFYIDKKNKEELSRGAE